MKRIRPWASTIGLSLFILTASAFAAPSSSSSANDAGEAVITDISVDSIDFNDAADATGDSQDLVTTELENSAGEDQPVDIMIDDPNVIDPINTDTPEDNSTDGGSSVISVDGDPTNVDGPWVIDFKDLSPGNGDIRYFTAGGFEDLVSMVQTSSEGSITSIAVPLPPEFGVGLVTMVGAAFYLRKKRI